MLLKKAAVPRPYRFARATDMQGSDPSARNCRPAVLKHRGQWAHVIYLSSELPVRAAHGPP